MPPEKIFAFFLFALFMAITPGPNNIMLTATGVNVGVRRGLPHLSGVVLGFGFLMGAVATGIGGVITQWPVTFDVLRIAGIAAILWLAWKIATAPPSSGKAARKRPVSFTEAAAFQWVNPKAWVFALGTTSVYLQGQGLETITQAGILMAVTMAATLISAGSWLTLGALIQNFLHTGRRLRVFNITMGVLLAGCVFFLI